MVRRTWVAVASMALVACEAGPPDPMELIQETAAAMGADNLQTIEYSGSGFDFALGQAGNPDMPWPRFINDNYTRQLDFQVPSSRVTRVRTQGENPPRGGGNQPVRGEQNQDQVVVVGPETNWNQQLEIWMTPWGFLKAAAANNATASEVALNGMEYRVLTFPGENGADVSAYINEENLIERIETRIDNPMMGDMLFEAEYSGYQDSGGVMFPMQIAQRQGGHPIFELNVTEVVPNAPVDIQPPEAGAGGGGGGGGGGAASAPSEQLGEGVYLILGGYAALAVEFADHIVVVEGPQSEARAQAIIDEAKRLIPNKPIRFVVNTHHHFDHASGLRTFIAEGATIVTHEINLPWYQRIFAEPHTLNPDRMAQTNAQATYEPVTDMFTMTDGNQVLEIHHVQGNLHNDGLLMVYLPNIGVLLEADGYNPQAQADATPLVPVSPYVTNLMENIERLNLDVERIVPVHYPGDGRVVTMAELRSAAEASE